MKESSGTAPRRGAVEGNDCAGGIVGIQKYGADIYNSCNRGDVKGRYAGGIAGYCYRTSDIGTIQNCYSTGHADYGIANSVGSGNIVADCYCSEESAPYNFGSMGGTEKRNKSFPASYMKTAAFVSMLNSNRGSNADWMEWELRPGSEYPQLKPLTDLSGCTVTLSAGRFVYTGEEIKPGVTVKLGGKTLTEGLEYSVVYKNNTEKGTGQVIVGGEGIYKGSVAKTFVIEKQRHVISCGTYYKKTYRDGRFYLDASLKTGDDDYERLSYHSSNAKVAAVDSYGRVTVKGAGRAVIRVMAAATEAYEKASVNVTVDVCPRRQSLTVKAVKGRKIKAVWTKDAQSDGYQVQYGRSRKFSKSGTTKLIGSRRKSSLMLKKLKKNKTYYIRVRSFKKVSVNGQMVTLYGAWSRMGRVKTTKR